MIFEEKYCSRYILSTDHMCIVIAIICFPIYDVNNFDTYLSF